MSVYYVIVGSAMDSINLRDWTSSTNHISYSLYQVVPRKGFLRRRESVILSSRGIASVEMAGEEQNLCQSDHWKQPDDQWQSHPSPTVWLVPPPSAFAMALTHLAGDHSFERIEPIRLEFVHD